MVLSGGYENHVCSATLNSYLRNATGFGMNEKKVRIGNFCTIAKDVVLGSGTRVVGHANLYGCCIGSDCLIGPFVEIQSDVTIGARTRIQSHSFICSGVKIGEDVFIGHNVSFINDRHPSTSKASSGIWKCEDIFIETGSSIGTGSIIMCGVKVGRNAVVGAGSLVLEDVLENSVVAGHPARFIRMVE
jgi:acetyltransferase-like isoleucine patch superfamily enzyme